MERCTAVLLIALAAAAAGCGDEEAQTEPARPAPQSPATTAAQPGETEPAAEPAARRRRGTKVTIRRSDFGPMVWGPKQQAVYIFELDPRGASRCHGECAEAWPPVYTRGRPRAGAGIREDLLGTIRRRGGRRQVTYAGKPLYYYAHEGPGEVLCHNVDLNGGLWWVVGADGRRRP